MWVPYPNDLSRLKKLLRDSSSSNSAVQAQVLKQLEGYNQNADYNNYLAYIFADKTTEPGVRAVAGLALKNNLKLYFDALPLSTLAYVQGSALVGLSDGQPVVRSTSGTLLTTLLSRDFSKISDILPPIVELIQSPDQATQESAFGALWKICEDSAQEFLSVTYENYLMNLLPVLIQKFDSPSAKVRENAIFCVNQFLALRADALMKGYFAAFIAALYQRAGDSEILVRVRVCQALALVLESRPDALLPQMDNIVAFMLFCMEQTDDETLSLEACEFWLSFAEQPELKDTLEGHVGRLLPMLLKQMVYDEETIMLLESLNEDASVPDNAQDIKPRHHKARTVALDRDSTVIADEVGNPAQQKPDENESDYDDEDEDETEFDTEWTLRKCSAATLDILCVTFGTDLLPVLLPQIHEKLSSPSWEVRESGILALGAISEGCLSGMMPNLPSVLPHLLRCLSDPHPLVKTITCWTLGRYSRWICDPPTEQAATDQAYQNHLNTYLSPTVRGLLQMMMENNKRVQEAGCSAIAVLEEEAGDKLKPYMTDMLNTFAWAFTRYQHKNLLILYDAVGTLADVTGDTLSEESYCSILMPPLIAKWGAIQDDDRDLFPLLECMASVAVALGPAFAPYAAVVWQRCVNLIQQTLVQCQMYAQDAASVPEVPDKDFMVVALDLLSGVAQGLGAQAESLVVNIQPSALPLLGTCMRDSSNDVQQSAYALLGDLAGSCFNLLRPGIDQILPDVINQITANFDPARSSVVNNAMWATGEIALRHESGMEPYIQPLLQRLVPVLHNKTVSRSIPENAAITIGRLALVCPNSVAPALDAFMVPLCQYLRGIRDNQEKESAFQGLCRAAAMNPSATLNHLVYFCDALVQWRQTPDHLHLVFAKVLDMFKTTLGPAQWEEATSTFPELVRQRLRERFGL